MAKGFFLMVLFLIDLIAYAQVAPNKPVDHRPSPPYNIVAEGDGSKFNYDSLPRQIIDQGLALLQRSKYNFPDDSLFSARILAVYGMPVHAYKSEIISLRIADFPPIALVNKRYILIQDVDSPAKYSITADLLYNYNQYIMYKDRAAFTMLTTTQPYLLKELVIHYGYHQDKALVKFVFKDFDFSSPTAFHELIFGQKDNKGKYKLRTGLLADVEQIQYRGKTREIESEAKAGDGYNTLHTILDDIYQRKWEYSNWEQTVALLCEKLLNVGHIGIVQYFISSHKDFIKNLRSNEYYAQERLKAFCENIDLFNGPIGEGTIKDPDGYTNLRTERNAHSTIIQRIKTGNRVEILDDSDDWWLVQTKEAQKGYIHKSRVIKKVTY
ncbi:MAG: SH3 domain-containing protein [Sphingobacterium sp.]|jgi:hypothetical protein|nr:SH3 domain-containing protein [Sphingobacterium sp.]